MTAKQFEKLVRNAPRVIECPECIAFECDEINFYAWYKNGYIVEYCTDIEITNDFRKILQRIINKTILEDEKELERPARSSRYEEIDDPYLFNGVPRSGFY